MHPRDRSYHEKMTPSVEPLQALDFEQTLEGFFQGVGRLDVWLFG